jgi:hypothetical protein
MEIKYFYKYKQSKESEMFKKPKSKEKQAIDELKKGAMAGAALGMVVPGIGTIAGAVTGAILFGGKKLFS